MGWRLYYRDGEIAGETQAEWDAANPIGPQFVVESFSDGRPDAVHMGMAHIFRREGQIMSCTESQLTKYLIRYAPWIKHGLWIPDRDFARLHARVFGDKT